MASRKRTSQEWSRDEAIAALRECAGEYGCRLTYADTSLPVLRRSDYEIWARHRPVPDLPALHRTFSNGWRGACLEADLGPVAGRTPRVTLRRVNLALKTVADQAGGGSISPADLDLHLSGSDRISYADVRYYWGDWQAACEANGLIPRKAEYEDLSADAELLRQLDEMLPMTLRPFNARRPATMPTAQTLANHLAGGSWIELQLRRGISKGEIEAVAGQKIKAANHRARTATGKSEK